MSYLLHRRKSFNRVISGGSGGGGGIALISQQIYSPNTGSATTPTQDTTGANLIVIFVGSYHDWQATSITDSKGNTWTALTNYSGANNDGRFFYCLNPTVGTGHTFTPNVVATFYTFIGVLAFSGVVSFHTENGATSGSNPLQPGAIVPAVNESLIVAGMFSYNAGDAPTLNSGFTYYGVAQSGNIGSGAIAYLIQTIAASINPTWSNSTGGNTYAMPIADFAP